MDVIYTSEADACSVVVFHISASDLHATIYPARTENRIYFFKKQMTDQTVIITGKHGKNISALN